MIDAGAGNDVIHGVVRSASFGNAGDDTLVGGYTLLGGEGNDLLAGGITLAGGPGQDRLVDGSILDGGPGNDTMDGGVGADRYFVDPDKAGVDLVLDSSGSTHEFLDAYYESVGIEDWESRRDIAVTEYHYDPGDNPSTFYSFEEVRDYFGDPDLTLEDAIAEGVEVLEPLPPLQIDATDYAALETYYGSGVIEVDILEFGEGVSIGDLAFTWSQAIVDLDAGSDADALMHASLDMRWSSTGSVRIVIPNPWDPIGSGIEQFAFADGSLYSISDLIALAPPMPVSEPLVLVTGTEDGEAFTGTSSRDRMIGLDGDDHIDGMAGSDELEGQLGDDTLTGGQGNDLLLGGEGSDVYEFRVGDGVDRIADSAGEDSIIFGEGITQEMLSLGLGSLLIRIGEDGDEIHIEGFDPSDVPGSQVIELFRFADGTSLTYGELTERGLDISGTDGEDTLIGSVARDRINGLGGNDVLEGGDGDDIYVIERGNGSDYISDASGENTVRFGDGIALEEIAASRDGDALILEFGAERVTVRWQPEDGYEIGRFEFSDGRVATAASFLGRTEVLGTPDDDEIEGSETNEWLRGLAGDDDLSGGEGNDLLEGGSGEDQLAGSEGNDVLDGGPDEDNLEGEFGDDTYIFGRGYGHDFIYDEDETPGNLDIIRFNPDIAPADIVVTSDSRGSLHFAVGQTADRLTVWDWFSRESQRIERVEFADGTAWSLGETEAHIVPAVASPFDDGLSGTEGDDYIAGMGGNDEIFGEEGNDALSGDDGDDFVHDTAGRNYLSGGAGDDYIELEGATLVAGGPGDDEIDRRGDGNIIAMNRGDGSDTAYFYPFTETGRFTLSLGRGISPTDLTLERDGSELVLGTGADESVRLAGWYSDDGPLAVEGMLQVVSGDVRIYDFLEAARAFDAAYAADPYVGAWPLWGALEANLLEASTDHAIGGNLAYQYATTGSIDGLSASAMQAVLGDPIFGFSAQLLTAEVQPENRAPLLATALTDVAALEDQSFSHLLAPDTFSDPDGDELGYSARLENGDALPAWLTFDPEALEFSGTPGDDDVGSFDVVVTAADPDGLEAADGFRIVVGNVNDAPEVVQELTDQSTRVGEEFLFAISDESFRDLDGDALNYSAALEDGSPLPGWISFDETARTFHGTPSAVNEGTLDVMVTVTDDAGASAYSLFTIAVSNPVGVVLEGTREGDVLTGTDYEDVLLGHQGDDDLHGAGSNDLLAGGRGEDRLHGDAGDDLLLGEQGQDALHGGVGEDTLDGGRGNDELGGAEGNDRLFGDKGNDFLVGEAGNDVLSGGNGRDSLEGGSGDDVIAGGEGADRLSGDAGDDLYLHELGGGNDTIKESSGTDALLLGAGLDPGMIKVKRRHDDLLLDFKGGNGSVTLEDWFASDAGKVETVRFADGTAWDLKALTVPSPAKQSARRPENTDGYASEPNHNALEHVNSGGPANDRVAKDGPAPEPGFPTDLLKTFLATPAHNDYEASQHLPDQAGQRGDFRAGEEVAPQWRRIRMYLDGLLDDRDEGARYGAAVGAYDELLDAGAIAKSFGHDGSTGVSRGAASMKTLQGLEEGFHRLHA